MLERRWTAEAGGTGRGIHGAAMMVEPAGKRWTVEELLAWEDGADRRYELVDGQIVAMAPPSEAHAAIVVNLGAELRSRLRPPCRVLGEAGIRLHDRNDT